MTEARVSEDSTTKIRVWWLFVLALVLCLPSLLWHNWPPPDAAVYYLRMAREFRAGNWSGAFFHMIPPLFVVATGIVSAVFLLPVMFAGKLVSTLFFAASVFPLFRLLRPIYGRRSAQIGCLLLIFCSRLMRNGAAPLLDSTKMFFFLWCVCLVMESFRRRPGLWRVLALAGAAAGLALVRGEGLVLAAAAMVAFGTAETIHGRRERGQSSWFFPLPWRSLAAVVIFLLLISPWALYMRRQTGYPVLDSRQISLLERIASVRLFPAGCEARADDAPTAQAVGENVAAPASERRRPGGGRSKYIRSEFISEAYKGLHRYYLPFYIVGLLVRLKRRQWNRYEAAMGVAFLGHALIIVAAVGTDLISARYIVSTIPLLFGWAAVGAWEIKTWLETNLFRRKKGILRALVLGLAAVMVFNGNRNAYNYLRRSRPSREYAPVMAAAAWLREEGRNRLAELRPPLQSSGHYYHPARRPLLLTANRRLPMLAAADAVFVHDRYHSRRRNAVETFEFSRRKTVDYIVIDHQWRQDHTFGAAELAALPQVELAKEFGEARHKVQVLALVDASSRELSDEDTDDSGSDAR